ncbi:WHG domain-containing protein [Paracoccus sp. Z330]|uniref:WHG domain-containing protein n=1 Tax=Paracoccus onchidii TaxID=3017813 RepID=A0ABT4ZHT0_9RHOB|nr:WHG domain-containing protein [Paracoccus onchidii]MDB6178866.1 WHG domain-containing protein [Paracoccus onchidii]
MAITVDREPANAIGELKGDMMGSQQNKIAGLGLHGRTIVTMLDMLEASQTAVPDIDSLATQLEVSEDDLRRIFPDRHAVIIAAAEQAMVRLMDACVKAVVRVDPQDSVAQFMALGEAYIEWADAHPSQFRLLSDDRLLNPLQIPSLRRYATSLDELMARMLERARDAGHLAADENIPLMVLSSRSFAYGLARMVVDQRMCEWYPDTPQIEAAKIALHDFVRRIARGSNRRTG